MIGYYKLNYNKYIQVQTLIKLKKKKVEEEEKKKKNIIVVLEKRNYIIIDKKKKRRRNFRRFIICFLPFYDCIACCSCWQVAVAKDSFLIIFVLVAFVGFFVYLYANWTDLSGCGVCVTEREAGGDRSICSGRATDEGTNDRKRIFLLLLSKPLASVEVRF